MPPRTCSGFLHGLGHVEARDPHYVTEELDAGPIIEQDVIRVTHRHTTPDLTRLGADIERAVLTHAVHSHCQDRVLQRHNTTVVF